MSETVFTYGAPALKFGAGASGEIGHDLLQTGARRVLLVTDAGVAATGHPARIAEQMADRGLDVTTYDGVHVEPTDDSMADAIGFAREHGPFDAVVTVGGGSAIDTGKAVNLLLTNPGELMDYVNAPVGKAIAPVNALLPLVAVPTTTGTGAESTTICVLDVLSLKVKTGISHPRAPADAGRGRPGAHRQPAGDGHGGGRDGHPLPRAGELHRPLVRRLRRQAARAAGALLRRQPDRRHVVGEGHVAARRRLPDRRPRRRRTRWRASRWRWPRRSPAWASAMPGCTSRTRTPTRSPAGCGTTGPTATPTASRSCRTGWRCR